MSKRVAFSGEGFTGVFYTDEDGTASDVAVWSYGPHSVATVEEWIANIPALPKEATDE